MGPTIFLVLWPICRLAIKNPLFRVASDEVVGSIWEQVELMAVVDVVVYLSIHLFVNFFR